VELAILERHGLETYTTFSQLAWTVASIVASIASMASCFIA
jgi:hypothetical protein